MKRIGNLYEKIYDMDNLKLAHIHARKGKGWYEEVKAMNKDPDKYLNLLQEMLINHTYQTSEYKTFIKKEKAKERLIYKLPYFPDRICQWAILQAVEPYLLKFLTADTYSAIPKKGIHDCLKRVQRAVNSESPGTKYCLKIDAKKFYPSINHDILKAKYRRLFKDQELLWLLDEIIDSTPGDTGIPIGNYLSQYSGNFYLGAFDHWAKEVLRVKYYYRYMDDIVIFDESKEILHNQRKQIDQYFVETLKLTVKDNWQVFPTNVRGVDFVGYRVFKGYTLLRKSTATNMKRQLRKIRRRHEAGEEISFTDFCSVQSYKGWIKHCNSYRLYKKYFEPIEPAIKEYYDKNLKGGRA
ncbi:RNA-directed DNA polymerase [Enterococcus timonensis]|uniref:RNA-directed DNA polymerase n=1 Tax=Enterococcus timonensis TaxID=1852364 RepID=UPI0008DB0F97|nr:RNA-directed DNA polymerase [Enterococcus timonensis]